MFDENHQRPTVRRQEYQSNRRKISKLNTTDHSHVTMFMSQHLTWKTYQNQRKRLWSPIWNIRTKVWIISRSITNQRWPHFESKFDLLIKRSRIWSNKVFKEPRLQVSRRSPKTSKNEDRIQDQGWEFLSHESFIL